MPALKSNPVTNFYIDFLLLFIFCLVQYGCNNYIAFLFSVAGAAREKLKKNYNKEIKARAKEILNSVRLCFEAFEDKSNVPLCPKLFSEIICNPSKIHFRHILLLLLIIFLLLH